MSSEPPATATILSIAKVTALVVQGWKAVLVLIVTLKLSGALRVISLVVIVAAQPAVCVTSAL